MTEDPTAPADAEASPPKRRVGLPPGTMTEAHKAALREGRERGRIVRAYLEALERSTRGRGRPITREGLQKRIDDLGPRIEREKDPLAKLALVQEKIDRQQQLKELDEPIDISGLEEEFVGVAAEYGAAKGISVEAWLELKVPRSVLKRAGIV